MKRRNGEINGIPPNEGRATLEIVKDAREQGALHIKPDNSHPFRIPRPSVSRFPFRERLRSRGWRVPRQVSVLFFRGRAVQRIEISDSLPRYFSRPLSVSHSLKREPSRCPAAATRGRALKTERRERTSGDAPERCRSSSC